MYHDFTQLKLSAIDSVPDNEDRINNTQQDNQKITPVFINPQG